MGDNSLNDYTWVVSRSPNPNKAWVVEKCTWTKISAMMGVTSAERICIAHNMAVKFMASKAEKQEIKLCGACKRPDHFGDCGR
jgi:hypothetical protein